MRSLVLWLTIPVALASLLPGVISDIRYRRVWLMRWQQILYSAHVPEVPDISPWPMRIAYLGTSAAVVMGLLALDSFSRMLGLIMLLGVLVTSLVMGLAVRRVPNADRALFLLPFPAAVWTILVNGPIAMLIGSVLGLLALEVTRRRTLDANGFAAGWLVLFVFLTTSALIVAASALIHL